jgi:competence protein ComEA
VVRVSLTRQQALVLGAALLVLLALAGKRLASTGAAQAPPSAPLAAARPGAAATRAERLVVHVAGSVRRAGVYRLPEGARVAEAIARAGGATRRADVGALNLAAPLTDGQQVLVPRREAAGGAPGADGPASSPAPGAKVSLSSATVAQLDELPGIGPVTAGQIVDWRTANGPFRSVDDLDDVPGIGPARIEQLRDVVTP